MASSSSDLHDVLIAGAGPVGLFLSAELALAGLSVLVLEREPEAEAALKRAPLGIRGLSIATAEILDRRGLLDELLDVLPPQKAQAGQFAGLAIDAARIDASRWTWRRPGPASTNLAADLQTLEALLAKRALALGVEIRRGAAVVDLVDRGHEVEVRTESFAAKARWLVGCDGGRSAVRRLAGFEFPGTEPEFTAYSALVDIADPGKLKPGRHATGSGFYFHQPGRIADADFDGGAFDRSQPITLDHLQAVLRRVSETDVTLKQVHLATSFTDRARLASRYRKGRVLLAGDAAHIHSALGGQGLNAGLGDAMNLGWKLAATLRGTAPADLLGSYHAERHPVGRWLLDWTRSQAALMRPDPQAQALNRIVADLIDTAEGATYFAEQLWGIGLRYDLGPGHPLAGRSAPDFRLIDGDRLGSRLRHGRAVLVDFDASQPSREAIAPWADHVDHAVGLAVDACGTTCVLVRPDGIVAWACDGAPKPADIAAAATRWFGAPLPR